MPVNKILVTYVNLLLVLVETSSLYFLHVNVSGTIPNVQSS